MSTHDEIPEGNSLQGTFGEKNMARILNKRKKSLEEKQPDKK